MLKLLYPIGGLNFMNQAVNKQHLPSSNSIASYFKVIINVIDEYNADCINNFYHLSYFLITCTLPKEDLVDIFESKIYTEILTNVNIRRFAQLGTIWTI